MKKRKILLGLGALSFVSLATVLTSCDELEQKYKVTFYNGTEVVESQNVIYGYNAKVPAAPEKTGAKFNGWYLDEGLTVAFDFGSIIEKDTSLYAGWVNESQVVFKDGDNTLSTQSVQNGSLAKVPTVPNIAGKTFNGWYADKALTQPFDFGTRINAPTTIYAGFVKTFNVSFKDGNEELFSYQVSDGKNVEVPQEPNVEGKVFNGWYKNAECTQAFDFGTKITAPTSVYAKFINSFNVSFKNGTEELFSYQVLDGKNVEVPQAPNVEGKVFNGWYKNPECNIAFDFGSPITEATSVYAGWLNEYAVVFKDGDTVLSSSSLLEGELVDVPESPTKENNKFKGWFKDAECTEAFDFGTPITKATTIYAGWVDKYTVSFMNGDTLVSEESIYDGELADVPTTVPSKTGYYFNGWFADKEFKEEFDFGNPITEATSAYAKFTKIDYNYISNHKNNVFETDMDYEKVCLDKYEPGEENVYNINQKDGLTIEIKDGKLVGTDASTTESAQAIVDFGGMSIGVLEGVLKYTPVNTNDKPKTNSGWSIVQWQGFNDLDQFDTKVLFALRTNGDSKIQLYFESECGLDSSNKKTYKFYGNEFSYTPNQEYNIYWKYDFYENKITVMIDDSIIVEDLDVPSPQPFILNNLLFITAGSDTKRGFKVDDVALMVDEGELEAVKTYYINLLDKLYSKLDLENDYKLYGEAITKAYTEAKEKIALANDAYEAEEAAFANDLMYDKSDKVIREYVVNELEGVRTALLHVITLYADDLNELTDEAIENVQKATTQEEFENSFINYFKTLKTIKTDATVRKEKATALAKYYHDIVDNIDSEMDSTKKDNYVAELDSVMDKYLGEDEDDLGIFDSCDITEIEAKYDAAIDEIDAIVTKYTSSILEYIETLKASYIEYVDTKNIDPEFISSLKAVELDFTNVLTNEAADQVLTDAKALVDAVVGLDDYLGDAVDTLLIATENMTEFKALYYDDYVADFVADVKNFISGTETEANIKSSVDSFIATVKSETEYTVKFYDGTTEMATLATSVLKDTKATKPTDPTKEGYEFAGWYNSDQLTTAFDFDNTTISANTNIYAKFVECVFNYTMPSTKQASGSYDLVTVNNNVILNYKADGSDSISKIIFNEVEYNALAFNGASKKNSRLYTIDLTSYASTDNFVLSMIIGSKEGKNVYVIDSSNMGDASKDASYKSPAEGKYFISFMAGTDVKEVSSGTNYLTGGKKYYITCNDKIPLAQIKLIKA